MAEHPTLFPNAKPLLLGTDGHQATLDGIVEGKTTTVSTTTFLTEGSDISLPSGFATNVGLSPLNVKNQPNFTFLERFIRIKTDSTPQTGNYKLEILRTVSGPVIKTELFPHIPNDDTLYSITLFSHVEPPGTNDYLLRITNETTGPITSVFSTGNRSKGFTLALDDTHQANLIGSNTQRTHENGVLPA